MGFRGHEPFLLGTHGSCASQKHRKWCFTYASIRADSMAELEKGAQESWCSLSLLRDILIKMSRLADSRTLSTEDPGPAQEVGSTSQPQPAPDRHMTRPKQKNSEGQPAVPGYSCFPQSVHLNLASPGKPPARLTLLLPCHSDQKLCMVPQCLQK